VRAAAGQAAAVLGVTVAHQWRYRHVVCTRAEQVAAASSAAAGRVSDRRLFKVGRPTADSGTAALSIGTESAGRMWIVLPALLPWFCPGVVRA